MAGFAAQGRWLTCHDGERDMSGVASKDEAQKMIKKNGIRKYLPEARSNPSDWRSAKSPEDIAKRNAAGTGPRSFLARLPRARFAAKTRTR